MQELSILPVSFAFNLSICPGQPLKKKVVRGVQVVGAIFGLGLTCVMGYQYLTSMNVPAWSSWQTMPFFVLLDLAMGAAAYPLFNKDAYRDGSYATAAMAIQVLAVVSLVIEAVHFASVGLSLVPFVVGAVMLAASLHFINKAKTDSGNQAAIICVLVIVGVVIARYAYYAASIL